MSCCRALGDRSRQARIRTRISAHDAPLWIAAAALFTALPPVDTVSPAFWAVFRILPPLLETQENTGFSGFFYVLTESGQFGGQSIRWSFHRFASLAGHLDGHFLRLQTWATTSKRSLFQASMIFCTFVSCLLPNPFLLTRR